MKINVDMGIYVLYYRTMKKLGINIERVKYEMSKKNWSQSNLAEALEVRRQYVSKLFQTRRCGFGMVERLAGVLEVENPKDLLSIVIDN